MMCSPLELEGVIGGEDGLAIDGDSRGHERDGARGEDDVLGSNDLQHHFTAA
jgi:hypothetical protein